MRQDQFLQWVAALGLNPNDVSDLRFVPEGTSNGPVRVLATVYCRNDEGKRYVVRTADEPGDTAMGQVARETRMIECPEPPTGSFVTLLAIRTLVAEYHAAKQRGAAPSGGNFVAWVEAELNRVPELGRVTVLTDLDFRALLDAWMCADPAPWPDAVNTVLQITVEAESRRRGYDGWVVAYHEFNKGHRLPCINGAKCGERAHCPPPEPAPSDIGPDVPIAGTEFRVVSGDTPSTDPDDDLYQAGC